MSSIGGSDGIQLDGITSDYQRRLVLGALQRVIRARHILEEARDALDRQYEAQANGDGASNSYARAEIADVAQLNAIRKDLDELRSSHTVFRKQAEKRKLSLELAERLALSRLGFADYEDYAAPRDLPQDDGVIDLAYLEYAEQELAAAEHELAALRRGDFDALPPSPADAAETARAAALAAEPTEALDLWAGPPPLPRRKLPHRKQRTVPTVKFASLPELPKTEAPATVWTLWDRPTYPST